MSDCEKYQEMISCLLDGELTAEESEGLRRHLEGCAECRALYEAFTALQNTLEEDMAEPPKALAKGVMSQIRKSVPKKTKRIIMFRSLAVAACFAVIVFAAVKADVLSGMKATTEAPAAADAAMEVVECCEAPAECESAPMPNAMPAPQEMSESEVKASDSITAYGFANFPDAGGSGTRNEALVNGSACDGCEAEEEAGVSEPILFKGEAYAYAGELDALPDGAAVLDETPVLSIPALYRVDSGREIYILNDALYIPGESGVWYVFRK